VAEMSGSPDAAALIHTLIELGHTLGLVTLAEGIEQTGQVAGLRSEHCDHGQGYLFSRPVPPSEIEHFLTHGGLGGELLSTVGSAAVNRRRVV